MKQPASLRNWAMVLVIGMVVGLSGCATGPDADPRDPLEPYNRAAHSFDVDLLDRALLEPLAKGYNYITPEPVNRGITNFFDNLRDVRSAINNLLQFKIGRAFSDVGRVAINTTVGILGLMDVASNMNLPSYKEDFGQTLGVWESTFNCADKVAEAMDKVVGDQIYIGGMQGLNDYLKGAN